MSPADLNLARELAAHRRWAWRAGTRALVPGRPRSAWCLYRVADSGTEWLAATGDGEAGGFVASWTAYEEASRAYAAYVPDLDDPATAGVLLAMLPRGWSMGSPGPDGRGDFAIVLDGDVDTHRGPTLASAAARALLAAWGPA